MQFMRVNGKMSSVMVGASKNGLMVHAMKAFGKMIKLTDRAS